MATAVWHRQYDQPTELRPIPGFPGYSASSDGRIWSEPKSTHKTGRWLRPSRKKSGHIQLVLRRNGRYSTQFVHRLVLAAFVGPCPPGMEACHYPDPNPSNNHVSNLRWDTRTENNKDSVRHGTSYTIRAGREDYAKGERNGLAKLTAQQVRQIIYVASTRLFTHKEIGKMFGAGQSHVSQIMRKEIWGHVWRKSPGKK